MDRDRIRSIKMSSSPIGDRRGATTKLREDRLRNQLLGARQQRFMDSLMSNDSEFFNPNSPPGFHLSEGRTEGQDQSTASGVSIQQNWLATGCSDDLALLMGKVQSTDVQSLNASLVNLRKLVTLNRSIFFTMRAHSSLMNILASHTGSVLDELVFNTLYLLTDLTSGATEDVMSLLHEGLLPILEGLMTRLLTEIRGRVSWYPENNVNISTGLPPLSRQERELACRISDNVNWMIGNINIEQEDNRLTVYRSQMPLWISRVSRVLLKDMDENQKTTFIWSIGGMIKEPLGILNQELPQNVLVIEDGNCKSILSSYVNLCAELFMSPSSVPSSGVTGSAIHCLIKYYKRASRREGRLPIEEDLIVRLVDLADPRNVQIVDTGILTYSIKLLGYIARSSPEGAVKIRGSTLPLNLPSFITSNAPRISKAALGVTGSLLLSRGSNYLIFSGSPTVIECVVDKLMSSNIKVVNSALWVMNLIVERQMSHEEHLEMERVLIQRQVVERLLDMCKAQSYPSNITSALDVLRMLFMCPAPESEDDVEEGSRFLQIAERCGLFAVLEGLLSHPSYEVVLNAEELMHELGGDEDIMDES